MRFYVMKTGAPQGYADALSACASNAGWVDRLPSAREALLLAPTVAGYGGGSDKTIWTADTNDCKYSAKGQSFFTNPLDSSQPVVQGCKTYSWYSYDRGSESVVCVPQSGPIGNPADL
jgi:hypothetical protein